MRVEEQQRAPEADFKLSEVDARFAYKRDLTETLQKLCDREIVPTISTDATFAARYIFTGGLDFAFLNYLQYAGDTRGMWARGPRQPSGRTVAPDRHSQTSGQRLRQAARCLKVPRLRPLVAILL